MGLILAYTIQSNVFRCNFQTFICNWTDEAYHLMSFRNVILDYKLAHLINEPLVSIYAEFRLFVILLISKYKFRFSFIAISLFRID